jgi:hypothetical protein
MAIFRFLVFLTKGTHLTFLVDTNLPVLVQKEKCFHFISRLFLKVSLDKGLYILLLLTVRDNSVMA